MPDPTKDKNSQFIIPLDNPPPDNSGGDSSVRSLDPSEPVTPPQPSVYERDLTDSEKKAEYQRLYVDEGQKWGTFNSLIADSPDLYEKDGIIYRAVSGIAAPEEDPPVGGQIQQAYNAAIAATNERKRFDQFITDTKGLVSTGAAYAQADPSKKVRDQFLDFLDTAESIYGLQADEQNRTKRALENTTAQRDALRQGDILPGSNMVAPTYTSGYSSLSNIARRSVPQSAFPDLNLSNGLAGGQTYSAIPGYAAGTGGASMEGVPQDLAWMVGKRDYPPDPPYPGMPLLPETGQQGQPSTAPAFMKNRQSKPVQPESILYSRLA